MWSSKHGIKLTFEDRTVRVLPVVWVCFGVQVFGSSRGKDAAISVGILYTPPFNSRAWFSKHLNQNDRPLRARFMRAGYVRYRTERA
jgi:hypothetical protein